MLVLALAFSMLFTPKTMRVDYFHTGDHGREIVALDRVVSDGPWAGSTTRLLDGSPRSMENGRTRASPRRWRAHSTSRFGSRGRKPPSRSS